MAKQKNKNVPNIEIIEAIKAARKADLITSGNIEDLLANLKAAD